ncbi:MAG TPA: vitamin K epoxide reductase family protein [Anaerolineales bacterium]|nr:vitamin K epoxide reductase family protein [Anaerolineales bacterium]
MRRVLQAAWLVGWMWTAPNLAGNAVVRAVLFFSPTCPHCHTVMTEDLPPLAARYGEQLQILAIDVTTPEGTALYQAAVLAFQVPGGRLGVPTLVVGNQVLVGSIEIPEYFPGLIEEHLARGGVDWPEIPGLPAAVAAALPSEGAGADGSPAPADSGSGSPAQSLAEVGPRLGRDPLGNGLSIAVLVVMLFAVIHVIDGLARGRRLRLPRGASWAFPALILVGLGVAGYLTYIEISHVTAVCGPVGDCNAVQQSQYARLFGWLPVGLLGVIGYVLIGLAWSIASSGRGRPAGLAGWALVGLTLIGTLFSMYLTFLEPFVIGATCAWCLTSAVILTLLMLLSARLPSRPLAAMPR